ncbi:MAG: hypothetical protein VKJ46_13620 [Leptolyngbyaceae bacterium]|nr:hypothetical protein [Leptolyngbyaceae bacterium]
MNTALVDALVQAVLALSSEEQILFQRKIHHDRQKHWHEVSQQIDAWQAKIKARQGAKLFDLPAEEILDQMREERIEQLMQAGFSERYYS